MKFLYTVDLVEGFRPVMQTEEKTELTFWIEAKNRATSDRMVRALLKGTTNVVGYIGVCAEE